jgi:hypothetical protein
MVGRRSAERLDCVGSVTRFLQLVCGRILVCWDHQDISVDYSSKGTFVFHNVTDPSGSITQVGRSGNELNIRSLPIRFIDSIYVGRIYTGSSP